MNDSIIGNVGDEKISTSTSKALMLSLSVPRIYRVYIPPKDQPEASQEARKKTELAQQAKEGRENLESSRTNNTDTTSDESQSAESANEGPLQAAMAKVASLLACDGSQPKEEELENDNVRVVQLKNERNASETIQEHDVGYVEADEEHGRRASIVEHVITKEEMQMIVKIEPTEEEIASIVHDVDIQLSRAQADSSTNSGLSEGFLGVINSRVKDIARAHLSRDEAVAAIKHYDHLSQLKDANKGDELLQDDQSKSKPNTEIKLGELLRLTVRTLYRENHFYNAPIYTNVQARIVPEAPDVDDWLEVSVMVKQSSIGIILERLERIGVGSSVGTIAIYKAELLKTCDILYDNVLNDNTIPKMTNGKENANAEASNSENTPNDAKSETVRADWTNAACRLRIEQVKEQIEEQAELALDYLVLLAVASMLAGIGLVTDNAVVIVASMLVSPLMGPVLGITFGTRVGDWKLTLRSTWHELLSLFISVAIGAIVGFCTAFCPVSDDWPTEQMSSRGDTRGLVAGIAIAIPSGMGVAVSILGNNTSSLVGVAISASLLPPAVNAGICWAYAILIRCGSIDNVNEDAEGNLYNFQVIAGISFALTMLNIVCIWVSGVVMFYIKEVAPARSKTAFWSGDIKMARAVQKGSKSGVNLVAIKSGLQDAIEKERKENKKQ